MLIVRSVASTLGTDRTAAASTRSSLYPFSFVCASNDMERADEENEGLLDESVQLDKLPPPAKAELEKILLPLEALEYVERVTFHFSLCDLVLLILYFDYRTCTTTLIFIPGVLMRFSLPFGNRTLL